MTGKNSHAEDYAVNNSKFKKHDFSVDISTARAPKMNHIIGRDNETEEMDTQEVETAESAEEIVLGIGDTTTEAEHDAVNGLVFTDQIMPNIDEDMIEPDDDSRSSGTFTFPVKEFSKMREALLSDAYYVRNLPWKIMLMQRNNNSPNERGKCLGYFLQCNGDADSTTWSCYACAQLSIVSQKEGVEDFNRRIQHLFYSKENDWGFSHFMSWAEIMDPERGFIKDDTVIFKAHVAADAPHGVCWDSKKHTGYVGLKNQGATCYMNSLLQTLYFTNYLRKSVYKMPTESDDSSKSVALALQRVFYDLQYSDKPVGTKKLTKSFGWETLDSFMQHDVQEFLRVLLDKLESKMKGTCVEGTVPKLFEGKMESFIKCKHVNYESKRTETFYDIQLNIKEKKNIEESFQDYVRTEVLNGDNKYDAGEHGLQDAEKGVIFESFPPVLHLHLMRFHYDPITDCCVKYNERFEFYEKINLDPYLRSPSSTAADYTLHAVLVHSGDNHGGHYVVYINPKGDGKWCKFDDDVVSRCTKQEAIDYNYGGQDDELNMTARHCTNAYMLVYIRDSDLSTVLQDVTADDIPSELDKRLQDEKRIEQIRRKERNESHLYMTINIFTEDCFDGYSGADLFEPDNSLYRSFRVKRNNTLQETLLMLCDVYKYPVECVRPWPILIRQNQTYRPSHIDITSDLEKSLADLTDSSNTWNIFLELAPLDVDPNVFQMVDSDEDVLLFLKLYEPRERTLFYIGHTYVKSSCKLEDILPHLREKAGYSPDTVISVYEEIRGMLIEPVISNGEPLEKILEEFADGDIFVLQKRLDEYPDCKEFYRELSNRVEIIFLDKNIQNDPGFSIELNSFTKYVDLIDIISERICIDKTRIQLFKSQTGSMKDVPGISVPYAFDGCLKDLLCYLPNKKAPRRLYYQTLIIPLPELETKKQMKLLWVSLNLKEEKEITVYPIKHGRISDILAEAAKVVEYSPDGSGKLRLLELSSSRLMTALDENSPLDALSTHKIFRVEEIPKDEVNLTDDEYLVPVAHFHKDIYSTFGVPFLLKLKNKETFASVKERIRQKLEVSEKEFEKYKFGLIIMGKLRYLCDDLNCIVDVQMFRSNSTSTNHVQKPWIGLEHPNKVPKRTRFTYLEKSIKIYN